MRIAYNPLYKPDDKTKVGALTSAPINDIVFDLPGKSIWAKGLKFLGTDSLKIIIGSSSDTVAGTWTGQHSEIGRYEDGLTIIYIPKVAGASTTTLNINGLGAKTCYYSGNSKLTTHYPAGTPILFTYYNDGWRRADYDSSTNYYRSIEVNDTALLGNNNYALNFKSDGNISYVTTAATSTSKQADLTIGINILNLKNNLGVSTIINNASTNDLLPTSKSVYDFVGTYLTSYMHWKGNTPSSGTTFTIPNVASVGDAYRIAVAGTLPAANSITGSAQIVEVGDIIICTDSNGPKYTVALTNWTTIAGTSTLAWNSEVTLATIGGLAIKAKLPVNPTTLLKSISFTKADGTAVSYNGSAAVDLTGGINYATLANLVKNNLIIKWGDTEGTNLFTYNGSVAKTIDLSIPFSLLFTNFSNIGSLTTRITIGGVTKDLKIDADTIDGYHASYGNNTPYGTIPVIHAGGWMDVGKQFEFHFDNTTGSDYSTALICTGNHSNVVYLPSDSGTLALTSQVPTLTGTGASGTWGISITGNAHTVDGYHATCGNNKPWGTIPVITTSGWMDVGRLFEFHYDDTGSDYSTVLMCTGNHSNVVNLPSKSGTLALVGDIPTKVSQLTNDSGYLTSHQSLYGYWHASGATWYPNANIMLGLTANGLEWSFDITRNGYTGGYWHVRDSSLGTLFKVDPNNGNCTAYGSFYANSDVRYKNIIEYLTFNVETLSEIPLFLYTWKDKDDNTIRIGSSAQSAELLRKEFVQEDAKGFKTLDYSVLGLVAGITACKELVIHKLEIELLKDRIELLELQLKMINDYGRC